MRSLAATAALGLAACGSGTSSPSSSSAAAADGKVSGEITVYNAQHESLTKERKELKALLGSEDKQWKRIADEIKALKDQFGQKTEIGKRRTSFAEAPEGVETGHELLRRRRSLRSRAFTASSRPVV